jgi:PleD family two-component response regulator
VKAGVVDSITSQTPAKILVVDDDVDNGLLLKDFLQISGFDVDVYFSSEEASRIFKLDGTGSRYWMFLWMVLEVLSYIK